MYLMPTYRNRINAAVIFFGVICTAVFPANGYGQNQSNSSAVRFLWAFGALVGPEGDRKLIPVDRDRTLHSGDRIKFVVAHQTPCFVYLFHLSDRIDFTLLYPRRLDPYKMEIGALNIVPSETQWFKLDDKTGTEKFYLLASDRRLQQIEQLYHHYLGTNDQIARQAVLSEIIGTIKTLRRKHLRNSGPVERPIQLGGNFRALEKEVRSWWQDLSAIAVEIATHNFYSRTFTIDHQ